MNDDEKSLGRVDVLDSKEMRKIITAEATHSSIFASQSSKEASVLRDNDTQSYLNAHVMTQAFTKHVRF